MADSLERDARVSAEGAETSSSDFGPYRLFEALGRGPTGTTFRGLDRRDGRPVIVRLAEAADSNCAGLRREARLLGSLDSDNAARLLDAGEEGGRAFSVVAAEDGLSLDRLPAAWRASMGQQSLLELLDPLLSVLEAVHRAGFLHGDISPANILLRRDGTPVLLDFASAVELRAEEDDSEGAAATPGFTAPERGDSARQGPGSDLFALAAVVYWLIVGQALEGGASFAKSAGGDKRFSPDFLAAVDAALAADIGARPASAGDWRAALLAAEPAERADAPSLAELTGASWEAGRIDLPPADELPPTVLLPAEERRVAVPVLRPDPVAAAAQAARPRRALPRLALAAGLLVLAAGGAAAGWLGWSEYRDASKQDWLVAAAGGGDTETLAEALARAPEGATISLGPGRYEESLVVERAVHLRAADGVALGEAVISPPEGPCLLVSAPGGSLKGLAFEGGDGAAPCLEVTGGALEVIGNRLGPWAGNGVVVAGGATPLIRENEFLDVAGSALVFDGGGGLAEDNRIERSGKSAVRASTGAAPTLRDNEISEAGQAGLLIEQGAEGHFADNRILASQASGIEVRGGALPRVTGNRVEGAGQAGLFLHEGARGTYSDNIVLRSTLSGVVVTGGAAPEMTGNEIAEGAQHGLLVLGGAGGRFAENKIRDNEGHGVVLGGGQRAELDDNALDGNRKPQLRRVTP